MKVSGISRPSSVERRGVDPADDSVKVMYRLTRLSPNTVQLEQQ
jgi:hypothetical protein